MLTISTKGRYGTRVMALLAKNYNKKPLYLNLKTIAQKEKISQKYLEQLLPLLKNAGLVLSTRGANGGYSLANPPQKINLLSIIEALEGPVTVTKCVNDKKNCKKNNTCGTNKLWCDLKENINNTFKKTTLKSLIK